MKSLKISLLVVSMFFSLAITAQGKTKIIGKIKKSKGKIVYLAQIINNKYEILDSSKVNLFGKYKFDVEVKKHEFYNLTMNKEESILLCLKGNEKIKVVTGESFKEVKYTIKGSADSKKIQEYFQVKETKGITKDSMNIYATNFIKNNSKSIIVFIAFSDLKKPLKVMKIAEKGIGQSYPGSNYHQIIKEELARVIKERNASRNTSNTIGSYAPELNMVNPEGELITLESLEGKYVLIDFWASWCGPCRKENPNVVKLYKKYKEKGFEILSVSLDNNKSKWLNAIKADGLIWENHVSDLKGWRSAATKLYRFRSIPYTVLIDKEGKVIAQRLRGRALENKLNQIFGE